MTRIMIKKYLTQLQFTHKLIGNATRILNEHPILDLTCFNDEG
jgi:hypothetical protein